MAKAAVLASGNGSNFQKLAEALRNTPHQISLLICDRKNAGCFTRAENLGIPSLYVPYYNREARKAEKEILSALTDCGAQIIFLAGFMKILSPAIIDSFKGDIINIHPALLPRHPGAHGIEDSFNSPDAELGITIHKVDYGMDTGPILKQASFARQEGLTIEEAEEKIHKLEHEHYPLLALELLDLLDKQ